MIDAGAGPKRARLRQMKTIATGLLAVMAVVFVIASRFVPAHPWLAWVQAFSEAALIGGLADWFAVVALFRHPAGVPLPHTAIVPHNKDRIGTQLGIFVEQNFLTPTLIASKLRELDLAGHVLRWFAVPRNVAALFANARALVPQLLDAVDDDEIRAVVRKVVADEVAQVDLSRAAGGVLEIVTADGAHQRVLARILPVLAGWLDGQRAEIKRRFAKRSLLTPGFVDAYIVNRFVDGMVDLVDEVARTPDHPMRREFDAYVRDFAARLRDDPGDASAGGAPENRGSRAAPSWISSSRPAGARCAHGWSARRRIRRNQPACVSRRLRRVSPAKCWTIPRSWSASTCACATSPNRCSRAFSSSSPR